jgi:ketosteroid isomerase-like protein
LLVAVLTSGNAARAQDVPDDVDVWAVIEQQWEASEQGETDWIDELLADRFSGWMRGSPAPRGKESIRMWQRFESKMWDGEQHELFPLSIVVQGETAIAHYLYTNAGKDGDGKLKVVTGRFTDILVRVEG